MSQLLTTTTNHSSSRRTVLNLAGGTLWHAPGAFGIARFLGPRYSLRCVLFHDVSDTESSFTQGTGWHDHAQELRGCAAVSYSTLHSRQLARNSGGLRRAALPPRPVLVTFDDAYASVSEFAAPLCSKFKVPAVFFVNGVCLDNQRLALDNLVCYVANVCGLGTINAAARVASGTKDIELRSLAQVFSRFLPAISLSAREVFREALIQLARIKERDLAAEAGLYLSSRTTSRSDSLQFRDRQPYLHPRQLQVFVGGGLRRGDRQEQGGVRGSLRKEGALIQRALRLFRRPYHRPSGAPSAFGI